MTLSNISSLLSPDDVTDWRGLCTKLVRAIEESSPTPARRIVELLSPETLAAVGECTRNSPPTTELKATFVSALNEILKRRDLHHADYFGGVKLPEDAQVLLRGARSRMSQSAVERLNRHLLEASFPQEIKNHEVTKLLRKWGNGADSALRDLLPLIYDDLRRRARRYLRGRKLDNISQATELVHMVIMDVEKIRAIPWNSRTQFINVVSKMMLHTFIDHLRMSEAIKRGGGAKDVPVGADAAEGEVEPEAFGLSVDDLVNIRLALEELEKLNLRQSLIFSLRTVWGFSIDEAAELLSISTATLEREHRKAKAFLYAQLKPSRTAEAGQRKPRSETRANNE
ncbi:MAG TPA: ECF-type sigma factor [Pyrinomonadaceae bacterium]|jgi:RNA polymerase sigma factor (TIGR02999 family)